MRRYSALIDAFKGGLRIGEWTLQRELKIAFEFLLNARLDVLQGFVTENTGGTQVAVNWTMGSRRCHT